MFPSPSTAGQFESESVEVGLLTSDLFLEPMIGCAGQPHMGGPVGEGIGDICMVLADGLLTAVAAHSLTSGRYL